MIVTPLRKLIDFLVTSILWIYFTFGFVLLFTPYFSWLLVRNRFGEHEFQRFFHYFFRFFFKLILFFTPRLKIKIDPGIFSIRSSIVISNHLSYLDPLLFVSIFKKHKTIVKDTFFKVPIFGLLLKQSGYIPSSATGKNIALVVRHISSMKDYLAGGGSMFVFPEGTRSRDGKLNNFSKGAFSIANQCRAPISVIYIQNTGYLFKPGTGLFNTCHRNIIELEFLGTIDPADPKFDKSAELKAAEANRMIKERMKLDDQTN